MKHEVIEITDSDGEADPAPQTTQQQQQPPVPAGDQPATPQPGLLQIKPEPQHEPQPAAPACMGMPATDGPQPRARALRMTRIQLIRLFRGVEPELPLHAMLRVENQEVPLVFETQGPQSVRLVVQDAAAMHALSSQAPTMGLRLVGLHPVPLLQMETKAPRAGLPAGCSMGLRSSGPLLGANMSCNGTQSPHFGKREQQEGQVGEAHDAEEQEDAGDGDREDEDGEDEEAAAAVGNLSKGHLYVRAATLLGLLGGTQLPRRAKLRLSVLGKLQEGEQEVRVMLRGSTRGKPRALLTLDDTSLIRSYSAGSRRYSLISAGPVPVLRLDVAPTMQHRKIVLGVRRFTNLFGGAPPQLPFDARLRVRVQGIVKGEENVRCVRSAHRGASLTGLCLQDYPPHSPKQRTFSLVSTSPVPVLQLDIAEADPQTSAPPLQLGASANGDGHASQRSASHQASAVEAEEDAMQVDQARLELADDPEAGPLAAPTGAASGNGDALLAAAVAASALAPAAGQCGGEGLPCSARQLCASDVPGQAGQNSQPLLLQGGGGPGRSSVPVKVEQQGHLALDVPCTDQLGEEEPALHLQSAVTVHMPRLQLVRLLGGGEESTDNELEHPAHASDAEQKAAGTPALTNTLGDTTAAATPPAAQGPPAAALLVKREGNDVAAKRPRNIGSADDAATDPITPNGKRPRSPDRSPAVAVPACARQQTGVPLTASSSATHPTGLAALACVAQPLQQGGSSSPAQLAATPATQAQASGLAAAAAAAAAVPALSPTTQAEDAAAASVAAAPDGPVCSWTKWQVAAWLQSLGEQALADSFLRQEMDGDALHGLYRVGVDFGFDALKSQLAEICGKVPAGRLLKLLGRLAALFQG